MSGSSYRPRAVRALALVVARGALIFVFALAFAGRAVAGLAPAVDELDDPKLARELPAHAMPAPAATTRLVTAPPPQPLPFPAPRAVAALSLAPTPAPPTPVAPTPMPAPAATVPRPPLALTPPAAPLAPPPVAPLVAPPLAAPPVAALAPPPAVPPAAEAKPPADPRADLAARHDPDAPPAEPPAGGPWPYAPRLKLSYRRFAFARIPPSVATISSSPEAPESMESLSLDVYPMSSYLRVGLSSQFGWESGQFQRTGDYFLAESASVGFQIPGRFTPFAEGLAGAGYMRRMQQTGVSLPTGYWQLGVDAGVEIYVAKRAYASVAVGYLHPANLFYMERALNSVNVDTWSLKVGVGI